MPRDRRPAVVLVVGILNMFFGGMNLVAMFCFLPIFVLLANIPMAIPGGNPWMGMYDSMAKRVPYLSAILIVSLLFTVIMNIALFVSGLGLWKMRPWARRTAIVYAIVSLAMAVIGLVVNLLWVNPLMVDWQKDFVAQHSNPNAPPPPVMFGGGMSTVMSVFGAVFGSIYPIAILVMMFLPHVRAAFARAGEPAIQKEEELPEVLDASSPPESEDRYRRPEY